MFFQSLNKGRIQPGPVQGQRCGLRSVFQRLAQRQDPAWFSAGSEIPHLCSGAESELWAPDCLPGAVIRPGTNLRVSCRLRSVGRGLEQALDTDWFSAGTERWAQECLSGL